MQCPACGGTPSLLGQLGTMKHFRCINCGWQWNVRTRYRGTHKAPAAFPRKGGGTYRALDPNVHAHECAMRAEIASLKE